uniref:Uncharacterized protein n=1 Tax=Timema monikensis TaxID=170555 RepID=A0A7R9HUJ5_9NEOP|nr:unnamed protein product [Timema monikensis]
MLYEVRISMKSAVATGEDKWSTPTNITFMTSAIVPGAPPKTDIGSFEVSGGLLRDVYIYWRYIPNEMKNGDKFEYKITSVEENGQKRNLHPNETTKAFAKFKGISNNSYRFVIVSANSVGYSKESSVVYVPSRHESPPEPLSFTKIAYGDGVFELSWKQPDFITEIDSYTIFWCENDRDRPYQCKGLLDWTHVSKNITIHNVTVPDDRIYQFAISANAKKSSSGMVWAACTVIHNKGISKMKSVWINRIGATHLQVGWKLDCSERIGTLKGYRIYYCPIVSPYNLTCKVPVGPPQVYYAPVTLPRWALRSARDFTPEFNKHPAEADIPLFITSGGALSESVPRLLFSYYTSVFTLPSTLGN